VIMCDFLCIIRPTVHNPTGYFVFTTVKFGCMSVKFVIICRPGSCLLERLWLGL